MLSSTATIAFIIVVLVVGSLAAYAIFEWSRHHSLSRTTRAQLTATAEHLVIHGPGGAADAFRSIACDCGVGDEVRLSAAELLATIEPAARRPGVPAAAHSGAS